MSGKFQKGNKIGKAASWSNLGEGIHRAIYSGIHLSPILYAQATLTFLLVTFGIRWDFLANEGLTKFIMG